MDLNAGVTGLPGYFEDVFDSVPGSDAPVLDSLAISEDEKRRFFTWFHRRPWAQAVGAVRRGIFSEVPDAVAALQCLSRSIAQHGFPPETMLSSTARRAGVPIGAGGVALFWIGLRPDVYFRVKVEGVCTQAEWQSEYETDLGRAARENDGMMRLEELSRLAGIGYCDMQPGHGDGDHSVRVMLKSDSHAPDLTTGRVYTVLEVIERRVRIIGDTGRPRTYPVTSFDFGGRLLPVQWIVRFARNGSMRLATRALSADGHFRAVNRREAGSELAVIDAPGLLQEEARRFLAWFRRGFPAR